jgi:hypothetical protein
VSYNQDKKKLRQLKQLLKKAGNKKRRGRLKRDLRDNPEEAHLSDGEDVGRHRSDWLNGLDRKAERQEYQDEVDDTGPGSDPGLHEEGGGEVPPVPPGPAEPDDGRDGLAVAGDGEG